MGTQQDLDSPELPFEIGVKIDRFGKPVSFCTGKLDASQAEHVAAKLVALAHAVREETRSAFF